MARPHFSAVNHPIAWADDREGQKSVYDVFRQSMKPTAGATVDEQVTADIKRHMANLLYPVDMSSFIGPDKDAKFRSLIILLQKQMGVPATGVLTPDQFSILAEASRDVDDRPVILPFEKTIFGNRDGSVLWATGTGTMKGFPINKTSILCSKSPKTCQLTTAILNNQVLMVDDLKSYEIKTWASDRVTAIAEYLCATETLTVDVRTQSATIITVETRNLPLCIDLVDKPSTWTLVDGMPIAQKISEDRINRARTLVYAPARKLMPQ
jgi:hypothetical protein